MPGLIASFFLCCVWLISLGGLLLSEGKWRRSESGRGEVRDWEGEEGVEGVEPVVGTYQRGKKTQWLFIEQCGRMSSLQLQLL